MLVFLFIGASVSLAVLLGSSQQSSLDRDRFSGKASQVERSVTEAVTDSFEGLSEVAYYIGHSTGASSPDDFEEYLAVTQFVQRNPALIDSLIVIESVAKEDQEAFLARERQWNPDFTVNEANTGFNSRARWVITRTAGDSLAGQGIVGEEVSHLALVLPDSMPTADNPISVLPLSSFEALVGITDNPILDGLVRQLVSGQFNQPIGRSIPGNGGKPQGLLMAGLDDTNLVEALEGDVPSDIKVRVQLLSGYNVGQPTIEALEADYFEESVLNIRGSQWVVTTWPTEDFATLNRSQTLGMLALGWLFASLAAGGLMLRNRGLHELEDVQQELEATSVLAGSDPMTGLLNRTAMMEQLEQAIDAGESVGVLFLDMDRFKLVNDTLGHDAGDDLLRAVAERISKTVRSSDKVARFGGDEFVVMLAGVKTITEATATAQAIQAQIQRPLMLGTTSFHPAASIGVAIAAESMFLSPSELLRQADTAMYEAKRSQQSGLAVFDASMREAVGDRLSLEQDLHEAVEAVDMSCEYEPVVDRAGNVCGYEVQAQWHHPGRGHLKHGEIQHIARQSGLIRKMMNQVIEKVSLELPNWPEDTSVYMNVDAHVLGNPAFGREVQEQLTMHKVNPQRLVLQISEEGLSSRSTQTEATMVYLSNYGVRFALNDFGKDQTSLSVLSDCRELSIIKLHKSMVENITEGELDGSVITAVVSVAQSVELVVAANGVKTDAQRKALLDLGVQTTQGPLHCALASATAAP